MNRRCRQTLLLCLTLALAVSADRSSAAAVDESTLTRAVALKRAGKLVEAEKLLAAVLAAIDDGTLAKSHLGRCVKPLAEIYLRRGRYDDALKLSLRYRGVLIRQSGLGAAERREMLTKNAGQLAEILAALGKFAEAEKYLRSMLPPAGADTRRDPVTPLVVRIKLARLAEDQQNDARAKAYWREVYVGALAALREIKEGKIDARHRANCAAALVAAYVAAEKTRDAIAVKIWLIEYQDRDDDLAPAIKTRMEIGILYAQVRDYKQSNQFIEQALAAERKRSAGSQREAELLDKLGGVLKNLGQRKGANERWLEAAAIYDEALRRAEDTQGRESTQIHLLGRILSVYQQAGRFDKAIEAGVQLLAIHKQREGNDHANTYATKSRLGALYGARGKYDLAQPLLREALEAWRVHQPPQPAKLALALNDMAVIERAVGSLDRAEALFDEALKIRKKLFKPDDLRVAHAHSNLATVFEHQAKYDRAVIHFSNAIAIYRSRGKGAESSLCTSLLNMAMTYKGQGQLDKSEKYCKEALQVYENAFGEGTPGSVGYHNALVALYLPLDLKQPAVKHNRKALTICRKNSMQGESVYATALHHRAQIAFLTDQILDAREHWTKALAIQRAAGDSLHVARSLIFLARIEQLQKNPAAAERLYREALSYQARTMVHYLARANLANILLDQGKTDEAEKLLEKAVQLVQIPRAATSGAEGERADHFAQFATAHNDIHSAFDLLIDLKLASGQLDAAFQYAEQ
ncbi:MAG: DUF2225 domain-containing protein, partial [Planctomycetes bacterium]|nr:DUF2225 domain-containing protein [Planctomycetota bacterium]